METVSGIDNNSRKGIFFLSTTSMWQAIVWIFSMLTSVMYKYVIELSHNIIANRTHF